MTTTETGKAFRYQLVVHNAESSSWSPLARHVLAGIPSKPSGLVVHRYAETPYLTLTGALNASAPPVAASSTPATVTNTGTDVTVNFGSLDFWGAEVTAYRIQWRKSDGTFIELASCNGADPLVITARECTVSMAELMTALSLSAGDSIIVTV